MKDTAASRSPILPIALFVAVIFLISLPAVAQSQAFKSTASSITLISVRAGTFTMGRRSDGDDGIFGRSNELPRHPVTLSAYRIGKFLVTNAQYCDILNWALSKGYLENSNGTPYTGGNVCKNGKVLLVQVPGNGEWAYYELAMIKFTGSAFTWKMRAAAGNTTCSMELHPVVGESWYGAVAYCNWLSERERLSPCYDLATWEPFDTDSLTTGIQFAEGYRLPTKAEWIRAASVEGAYQWIYGFRSDTLSAPTGSARVNYRVVQNAYEVVAANPMGLLEEPFTSPVGWFDGKNISPNGNVQTVNSPSPVGAYDMCGNVREWIYDWATTDPLSSVPETNPTGPSTGTLKLMHGGSFDTIYQYARVYCTDADPPGDTYLHDGFRVARSGAASNIQEWALYH